MSIETKLKIALVFYEFPPDTGGAGIGTYSKELFTMLTEGGHYVEVFSGAKSQNHFCELNNGRINRTLEPDASNFRISVLPTFCERHHVISFDVIESPEYKADALEIKKKYPNLPLNVSLHTSSTITDILNNPITLSSNLRFWLGGLLKLEWNWPFDKKQISSRNNKEQEIVLLADSVTSPSIALASYTAKTWQFEFNCDIAPHPYRPSKELLSITPKPALQDHTKVYYLGRLEQRKGIVNLFKAIPKIASRHRKIDFNFVGKSCESPLPNLDMRQYGLTLLSNYKNMLNFKGPVDASFVPKELMEADICIFPSIWEGFGYVCLEAMAAGKAVIASKNGGMAEIISNETGMLINPKSTKQIANAIIKLATNVNLRHSLGTNARRLVLDRYSYEAVLPLKVKCYQKAIQKNQSKFGKA